MFRLRTLFTFLGSTLLSAFLLQWEQRRAYPHWLSLTLIGVTVTGAVLSWRKQSPTGMIAGAALGVLLALHAVARTTPVPYAGGIDFYADGKSTAVIEGWVTERPEHGVTESRYVLMTETLTTDRFRIPITGKVLLRDRGGWPKLAYGERLRAQGVLERPSGSKDFRYDHYLSVRAIGTTMESWAVEKLPGWNGNIIFSGLDTLRGGVESKIQTLYGEPHASLLMGLLTGARSEMPPTLKAQLSTVGLTHLVAISGFNITLLLTIIDRLLFWIPFRWRLLPSAGLIAAFTLFVGAGASVVRAAIMGTLGMLASTSGRIGNPRLTVLWALVLMTLWNPRQLWYDPGFHLSFLALLGIAEVAPLLEPLLKRVPDALGLRDAFRLTLAAQITTAPLSAFQFGQISLIAPLSNLLAPPLVPIAMLLGTISVVAGFLEHSLGILTGALTFLPLHGIVLTAEIFSRFPLALFEWKMPLSLMLGAYAGIITWIVVTTRSAKSLGRSPAGSA